MRSSAPAEALRPGGVAVVQDMRSPRLAEAAVIGGSDEVSRRWLFYMYYYNVKPLCPGLIIQPLRDVACACIKGQL